MKKKNKKTSTVDANEILNDSYRFSRWAALYEAVSLIFDHSKERKKDFADIDLKPLAIQKFVEIKSDEILQHIQRKQEQKNK